MAVVRPTPKPSLGAMGIILIVLGAMLLLAMLVYLAMNTEKPASKGVGGNPAWQQRSSRVLAAVLR